MQTRTELTLCEFPPLETEPSPRPFFATIAPNPFLAGRDFVGGPTQRDGISTVFKFWDDNAQRAIKIEKFSHTSATKKKKKL